MISICGGVSANVVLRKKFESECEKNTIKFVSPDLKYATDNAAMVAVCASYLFEKGIYQNDFLKLNAMPSLDL